MLPQVDRAAPLSTTPDVSTVAFSLSTRDIDRLVDLAWDTTEIAITIGVHPRVVRSRHRAMRRERLRGAA